MDNLERAKKPARLPVVLTENEVRQILAHLDGRNWLMASLLYGAGLRFASKRTRYKDGAGAAGSQGCFDDDGLYTCPQPWRKRSAEPAGSAMSDAWAVGLMPRLLTAHFLWSPP